MSEKEGRSCFPLRGKWPKADRGGSTFPSGCSCFCIKRGRKIPRIFLPPSLPERFPVLHRLPLWCASSLACTFRSPVLSRSFCLRVFAFPFGSAIGGLSRVIHPGHIRFFRPFLYRRHKKRRITPAAFCTLSVCSPLFAVKSFLLGAWDLRLSAGMRSFVGPASSG